MASAQKKFSPHRVRLRHKEGISVEGDGSSGTGVHPNGLNPRSWENGSGSEKLSQLWAFTLGLLPLHLTWYLMT